MASIVSSHTTVAGGLSPARMTPIFGACWSCQIISMSTGRWASMIRSMAVLLSSPGVISGGSSK